MIFKYKGMILIVNGFKIYDFKFTKNEEGKDDRKIKKKGEM